MNPFLSARISRLSLRLNLGRILISLVLAMNVHCGIVFVSNPHKYATAYELSGIPGEAAIQGFGILFLMWNIPYLVALINPRAQRISLYQAIIMQSIGLFGESYIYLTLPLGHPTLSNSIFRFIVFDGGGLLALVLTLIITREKVG